MMRLELCAIGQSEQDNDCECGEEHEQAPIPYVQAADVSSCCKVMRHGLSCCAKCGQPTTWRYAPTFYLGAMSPN